jgi:hypothetical protein
MDVVGLMLRFTKSRTQTLMARYEEPYDPDGQLSQEVLTELQRVAPEIRFGKTVQAVAGYSKDSFAVKVTIEDGDPHIDESLGFFLKEPVKNVVDRLQRLDALYANAQPM